MSIVATHRWLAIRLAVTTTLLITVFIGWPQLPPTAEQARMSGLGNPASVRQSYRKWQDNYAQSGGDRKLTVPLAYWKGLSAGFTRASGQATLDLISGTMTVSVSGLPDAQNFDVWLVDNRSYPGNSVKPEPGDAMLQIGTLHRHKGVATLETRLDLARVRGLEIDLVSVVPSGEPPLEAGLLYGAPTLFQRIYHGARPGLVAVRGDAAPQETDSAGETGSLLAAFQFLVPRPANAARTFDETNFDTLVRDGEVLFFEETFNGNGRTCGTCHPADNNFTLDPSFIATLPDDDPLFVAETNAELAELEVPSLLRELGLILENVDGFTNEDGSPRPGVMRGVPGVSALALSITPPPSEQDRAPIHRLGWSGDGGAGAGSLREFAIGAIVQHATSSMNRAAGVDFRLPSEYEMDAMEAFQLSLGPQEELDLGSMEMTSNIAERGRLLFLQETSEGGTVRAGKCHSCHANAGANPSPLLLQSMGIAPGQFNLNLDIGISRISEPLGHMIEPYLNPHDAGFGRDPVDPNNLAHGFGTGAFNIPRLVEAADSAPFGHNNTFLTLESFLAFYLGAEFNMSPAAAQMRLMDPGLGSGVLTVADSELGAIAAFLRVINARENIRQVIETLERLPLPRHPNHQDRAYQALLANIDDAIDVLSGANLHPDCVAYLEKVQFLAERSRGKSRRLMQQAIDTAQRAMATLVLATD